MTTTADILAMADKLESRISAQVLAEAAALLRKLAEDRKTTVDEAIISAAEDAYRLGVEWIKVEEDGKLSRFDPFRIQVNKRHPNEP